MIVSFWSIAPASSGITTNLAAIASCLAAHTNKRIVAFENHTGGQMGIEEIFLSNKPKVLREDPKPYYYNSQGLDRLYKVLHAGLSEDDAGDTEMPVLKGSLNVLTGSFGSNPAMFDYEMNSVIDKLLLNLQKRYEYVFADTKPTESLSTKYILGASDVVVVNINQDEAQFAEFMENYAVIFPKALFVINKYDPSLKFNVDKIKERFNIPEEQIAIVKECSAVPLLCSQGRIAHYVAKHMSMPRNKLTGEYLDDIQKVTRKLVRYANKRRRAYCLSQALTG